MKRFIFIIFIACHFYSYSSNDLRIIDPQNWWWYWDNGLIEEAEITIRPLGSFVEYNLYLTISAENPYSFGEETQLEIIMDFELPLNSMITDSWLWIYGEPKQADLMDRWSATTIYESIVNRQKDPSLLVKNSPSQYKINIYPMLPNESRKIKITYLSPTSYVSGDITVELPVNIFNLSSTQVPRITVYYLPSKYYSNPKSANPGISFISYMHPEYGSCKKSIISSEKINDHQITLERESNTDYEFSYFGNPSEGFYQLSFVPSDWIEDVHSERKICFLIDYDNNYFLGDSDKMLRIMKEKIINSLNEEDSFNVIFSGLSTAQAFQEWMPATIANIDSAFEDISVTNYSNHTHLLAGGINFIKDSGGNGRLVLVTNCGNFQSIQQSNEIINDISSMNTIKAPINIIDYGNKNLSSHWINNRQYMGNSYFFTNLAKINNGEYLAYFEKNNTLSLDVFLNHAFTDISDDVISRIDVYTKCDEGFTSGRTNLSSTFGNNYKLKRKIHQIGRYHGGLPSSAEISFELKREAVYATIELNEADYIEGDSTIRTMWQGLDIIQLENQGQNNQVISEIVYQSLENRILSLYTAFLCVEDSIDISEHLEDNFEDEWVVTALDDFTNKTNVKVYPNPFISTLKIELPVNEELQSLKIININGQCVKNFKTLEDENIFVWDGLDDSGLEVESGIYIIIAAYKGKVISSKVIKQ
jgi:hypothetical protein